MSSQLRKPDGRLGWEPIEYPTAGQRYVQARYLRNQARREAQQHREHADYLRTDANESAGDPDPDNLRFAGCLGWTLGTSGLLGKRSACP